MLRSIGDGETPRTPERGAAAFGAALAGDRSAGSRAVLEAPPAGSRALGGVSFHVSC